jgi:pyruvate kinase
LQSLSVKERVLLDDGKIELQVIRIKDHQVECKVLQGGILVSGKGVNLPAIRKSFSGFTKKDKLDVRFGISLGVDWIAMSFVRRAEDLSPLHEEMKRAKCSIPIIAKIEKPQAIKHLDAIIKKADGIMVARGDLGVEVPLEKVPLIQKEIIDKCNRAGKPVIVATQMLESMTHAPRPTRAEVSDIANAILDGADAMMLSGETAIGDYPIHAVKVMNRVAKQTEKTLDYDKILTERTALPCCTVTDAISQACGQVAADLQAAAIITSTNSGHTAAMVSRLRPAMPLLAITSDKTTLNRLTLWWGVQPFLVKKYKSTDEMTQMALKVAKKHGYLRVGQKVVVSAGMPPGISGFTNLIKVETVK